MSSDFSPEVVNCARVGGPLVLPFPDAPAPKWLGSTGSLWGPHQSWAPGRMRRWGPGRVGRLLTRVREAVGVRDTSTGGSERKGGRAPRGQIRRASQPDGPCGVGSRLNTQVTALGKPWLGLPTCPGGRGQWHTSIAARRAPWSCCPELILPQ